MSQVLLGNCLDVLKTLPDNSVDSVCCDPPYELGFMGKSWDGSGIANNPDMWREVLRVLKPGGHLLSFSGTRTYHRQAVAIEDAGFEIRDMVEWVYGSGFPKSLNIGKAVDKLQGNEREVVGDLPNARDAHGKNPISLQSSPNSKDNKLTKGTSPWEGWGTALKPAHEPICLARKPIEGTVANNVLKYGTGGLNIDKSRVGTNNEKLGGGGTQVEHDGWGKSLCSKTDSSKSEQLGRFPANLLHDGSDEVVREFPNTKSGGSAGNRTHPVDGQNCYGKYAPIDYPKETSLPASEGSAARFFKSFLYCPKASKSERDRGCEGMEDDPMNMYVGADGKMGMGGASLKGEHKQPQPKKNNHPTVKPLALMKYLIQMITPPGGTVLDPFAGSGSTLVAAKELGFKFIGIEMTEEYIPIIEARLNAVKERLL
jgi:DNA modification methylase